ncbi:MAG: DNA-binding protein, partial [Sphingomonadaceae bacterium]|nr:DNA-binding protein [Sphingomonadaceae bacterium]
EETYAAQAAYASYDHGSYAADGHGHGASAEVAVPEEEPEEDGIKPLSDRLTSELTAFRTVALRHALGEQPDIAFLAALHALALPAFYHYSSDTCLELSVKSVGFGVQAPGLKDSAAAVALDQRHRNWAATLPKQPGELWEALSAFDTDSRQALFAHCVGLSVNAAFDRYTRRPKALVHADQLAVATDLDAAAAGWTPTVDSYFGQVTKARIVQSVREARGERAADRIAHLKKGDMAKAAEGLLAGTGWLPEPLRTPGHAMPEPIDPKAELTGAAEVSESGTDEPAEPAEAEEAEAYGPAYADAYNQDIEPAHAFAAE